MDLNVDLLRYLCKLIILFQFSTKVSEVGDLSRGWPEGSLFDSYYTEV